MPDYCVVCRAQAGVRFGKGDPLVLNQFRTVFGPVDVVLKTRIVPHEGFTKPVPMGLLAEVRGSAPSLDQALEEFSKVVRSICPVLVYIANSPIEEMLPEIGFETTNGIAEREFFQQFIGEEVILPIQRRRIPSDLATRILQAVFTHVESERIRRAIGQYYQALRNWEPGNESLALAHLWMGVEAFTPVVVRRVLEQEGATRTELAAAWAVEARNLEAEVRKRLILRGDTESYSKARMASDGLEHGFLGFAEINTHAELVRTNVAQHLRHAILNELALAPEDEALILGSPYDRPGHLRITKYFRSKLIGSADKLAAPDQEYPHLIWRTEFKEVPGAPNDHVTIKVEETFTARLGPGVSLRPNKIEVWGGQETDLQGPESGERAV